MSPSNHIFTRIAILHSKIFPLWFGHPPYRFTAEHGLCSHTLIGAAQPKWLPANQSRSRNGWYLKVINKISSVITILRSYIILLRLNILFAKLRRNAAVLILPSVASHPKLIIYGHSVLYFGRIPSILTLYSSVDFGMGDARGPTRNCF